MFEHYNGLTPSQQERLSILLEECGEVLQIIGKIQRHGYDHQHPKYGELTNRGNLEKELADLLVIIDIMIEQGDFHWYMINQAKIKKRNKIGRYLHHNTIPVIEEIND
jgi:NTP pyrophosphatase (non-canonical NTP hydrolase)